MFPTTRLPSAVKRLVFDLTAFSVEVGQVLVSGQLVYTTRGVLNSDKTNAILVPSPYADDDQAHDFLVGSGMALDPAVHFIIATNQFGNGISSSPSNASPDQQGPDFPAITIRDDVEAQYRLINSVFGIRQLKAVVGFSMGGQQALQWSVSRPDLMLGVVALCSTARESPFGFARLAGAKGAIMGDSAWSGGRYSVPPLGGLSALGLHWAAWAYSPEWWRRGEYQTAYGRTRDQQIDHWKEVFLRSDANDLLLQATKWQNHNVGDSPGFAGSPEQALRSIKARVLLMPSATDQYFLQSDIENDGRFVPDVEVVSIPSVWGHTAGGGSDPVANRFINKKIRQFISSL